MSGVVIIGAGQAGLQIAESLRRGGHSGHIVLLGDESWLPYQRPPLSKKFLAEDFAAERLYFRPQEQLAKQDIEFRPGVRVTAIDRAKAEVVLDTGEHIAWERLAIATGTRVRPLPVPGADHPAVCYLRGIDDGLALKSKLAAAARVVVIGGGFIGLEVAATAIKSGKAVTVVEAQDRLMARAVAPVVSTWFADLHRGHGVDLRLSCGVTALRPSHPGVAVLLADGSELEADLVLAGIGVLANDELAAASGLACSSGIIVDEFARTSDPRIVAAGDCTVHRNLRYAAPHRLESVQNAVDQAKVAAASLLGQDTPYRELPWFWSDQYEVKLQMAGLSSDHDEAIVRGSTSDNAFGVYYFKAGELVCVDTINKPAEHMLARRLLGLRVPVSPAQARDTTLDLKTLLPTG